MHPGWADTPSVREAMPEFYEKMKDKLKTAEEGADTILYLSMAPLPSLQSGGFYFDR
jgi:dehydrogenase/reductase SDR family protein 12